MFRREMFSRRASFVGNHGIAISGNLGKLKRAGYRDRVQNRRDTASSTIRDPRFCISLSFFVSLYTLRRIFGLTIRPTARLSRIGRCSQRQLLVLHSRIASRHVNHEAPRRLASDAMVLRDGPGTELFIDAPSNKLFPAERTSGNNAGGVLLPYKRTRTISARQCAVPGCYHDMALFGRLCQLRRCFHGRYDGRRRKMPHGNKRHPQWISSKDAPSRCFGSLRQENDESRSLVLISRTHLSLGTSSCFGSIAHRDEPVQPVL